LVDAQLRRQILGILFSHEILFSGSSIATSTSDGLVTQITVRIQLVNRDERTWRLWRSATKHQHRDPL